MPRVVLAADSTVDTSLPPGSLAFAGFKFTLERNGDPASQVQSEVLQQFTWTVNVSVPGTYTGTLSAVDAKGQPIGTPLTVTGTVDGTSPPPPPPPGGTYPRPVGLTFTVLP